MASTNFRILGAVALAGSGSLAPAALDAQIIYSGPVNINVPSNTTGIYLNLVTGASSSSPASAPGWDINPWSSTTLNIWANNAASPNDGVVTGFGVSNTQTDNLALGTLVDGSLAFARTPSTETAGFALNSSNNYVGFRFLNESTGAINFGWVQFSLAGTLQGQPRAIIGYAFNNTGAGIQVGDTGVAAVPEPGTYLAGLAAGAVAIRAWRRRKSAPSTQAA